MVAGVPQARSVMELTDVDLGWPRTQAPPLSQGEVSHPEEVVWALPQ